MSPPKTPPLSITTPLGPTALIPVGLRFDEALSEPFVCVVDLESKLATIDPDRLLHQPVCVSLTPTSAPTPTPARKVHGLVRRFVATGPLPVRGAYGYRAEIVPRLWFLSQTEDCRIFEKKTTMEIVQAVLKDRGVPVAFRTAATPPRPFTMQYNESDLHFVSRLLQDEGWFYFFSDQDCTGADGATVPAGSVVVSDRVTTLAAGEIATVTPRPGIEVLTLETWQASHATAFGKVRRDDYDPDRPTTKPDSSSSTTQRTAGAPVRGSYHWPAYAVNRSDVERRTRQRIEAAEVEAVLAEGTGFHPQFTAGGRIKVAGEFNPGTFVLHSVSHRASDETWRNGASPYSYSNSFTAFPAAMPWRPLPTLARPCMAGVYSATVLGPDGQEIHTDELGRVMLRFRWDYRVDGKPGAAVWVRVMQPWAGANAGWSFIPRVGTEVVVSFMDGDPDRPVVIGQLHNGNQTPPWNLPDNKTRSGLRTRSTPKGGSEECSELWFDDKAGEEQVMLHAQRDLTVEAERDATHDVGRNRTVTLHSGDDKLTVETGSRTVDVPQGDHTIKSTTGNIAIKTAAGAISIEAMTSLTLKVGQSSITLDPCGVTIKGMMVQTEGQLLASLKAPITQLDADGLLKAAGGIMMLN